MNLHYNYNIDVDYAYINYLPSNLKSVQYKDECVESYCEDVRNENINSRPKPLTAWAQ
jgi:hypothetical protein